MLNLTQMVMQQWGLTAKRQVFNREALLLSTSAMLAMLLVGCSTSKSKSDGPPEDHIIKIGFLYPETGPLPSDLPPGLKAAAEIALAQANVNYLDQSIEFEMVYADTGCSGGTMAATAAQTLKDAGVVGVVGGACSGASLEANKVLSAAEIPIPMISYGGTSPLLSDQANIFRVLPSDALSGEALADVMTADGMSKIAVFFHPELNVTKEAFENVIGEDSICTLQHHTQDDEQLIIGYDDSTTDFSSDVAKIISAGCDSVMIASYEPDGAALIEELNTQSFEGAIYGADGIADAGLASYMSDDADLSMLDDIIAIKPNTDHADVCGDSDVCSNGILTAEVHDAVSIMAQASVDLIIHPEKSLIQNILDVGNVYQGASGEITFDDNGDILGSGFCVGVFLHDDTTGAVSFNCTRSWSETADGGIISE